MPYRSNSLVLSEHKQMELVNNGCLLRSKEKEQTHFCNAPGFFKRLWKRIKPGDTWICKEGHAWWWGYGKRSSGEYFDFKSWSHILPGRRDQLLDEAKLPNPWKGT